MTNPIIEELTIEQFEAGIKGIYADPENNAPDDMMEVYPENRKLAERLIGFQSDPVGFVMWAINWDSSILKPNKNGVKAPHDWQMEELRWIGGQYKRNLEREARGEEVLPVQCGYVSGHGVGKSTLTCWLILWFMCCFPNCNGRITAPIGRQLQTTTWSELKKWFGLLMPQIQEQYQYSSSQNAMWIRHKKHKENWKCWGFPSDGNNSSAFQGMHCDGSVPFYIFDEAASIHPKIWEVAHGGLTDGLPFWMVLGNPEVNSGEFRECFRKNRDFWHTRKIDTREVKHDNKQTLYKNWAAQYGEDSDWFRVRVRGEFPRASSLQFISEEFVDNALYHKIHISEYEYAPVIIGIDAAYSGLNRTVVVKRQGTFVEVLLSEPKTDDHVALAWKVKNLCETHKADYVYLDQAFGTTLRDYAKNHFNLTWTLVPFGSTSLEAGYKNMIDLMYGRLLKSFEEGAMSISPYGGSKTGGDIYEWAEALKLDLISIELRYNVQGKIELEGKKEMLKRGIQSPDYADALALTYAGGSNQKKQTNHDETGGQIHAGARTTQSHSMRHLKGGGAGKRRNITSPIPEERRMR